MAWRRHLRLLALSAIAALGPGTVAANALSDAWACARDSVNVSYQLAVKGAKAAEVLGAAPQCVALALLPDPPLLVMSGAMVALNAASPAVLPAKGCEEALKSTAVWPIAKLLDAVVPSGAVGDLLKGEATQAAKDQLWQLLNTPPLDQFTGRASCGCTFLEAGITVQTLKEMLQTIAKAGESCDKLAENIPGYKPIKAGVAAGLYELNNQLEGVFTDQAGHMPVAQYFEQEYQAYPNSHRVESHAVAKALSPGHSSVTSRGAAVGMQYVGAVGQGAPSSNDLRSGCVAYFDSHKMSKANANKTCDVLAQQFESYYQQFVPAMVARDGLMQQLIPALKARREQRTQQCEQAHAAIAKTAGPGVQLTGAAACKERMAQIAGGYSYPDVTPPPGTSLRFFRKPDSASGIYALALSTVESTGNAQQALAIALAAFDTEAAEAMQLLEGQWKAQLVAAKDAQWKTFDADVGKTWLPMCPQQPALLKGYCAQSLLAAWELWKVQLVSAPPAPGCNKDVCPQDPAAIQKINDRAQQGYQALAQAWQQHGQRFAQAQAAMDPLCLTGNPPQSLKLQCQQDKLTPLKACTGGFPSITPAWYQGGGVERNPEPAADCKPLFDAFAAKWGADDHWLAQINTAYSGAAQACIQTQLAACQTALGQQADGCRAQVNQVFSQQLAPVDIGTPALGPAVMALEQAATACIAKMKAVPAQFAGSLAAELLAQHLPKCPTTPAQAARDCRQALEAALKGCGLGQPTPAAQRAACEAQLAAALQSFGGGPQRAGTTPAPPGAPPALGRPAAVTPATPDAPVAVPPALGRPGPAAPAGAVPPLTTLPPVPGTAGPAPGAPPPVRAVPEPPASAPALSAPPALGRGAPPAVPAAPAVAPAGTQPPLNPAAGGLIPPALQPALPAPPPATARPPAAETPAAAAPAGTAASSPPPASAPATPAVAPPPTLAAPPVMPAPSPSPAPAPAVGRPPAAAAPPAAPTPAPAPAIAAPLPAGPATAPPASPTVAPQPSRPVMPIPAPAPGPAEPAPPGRTPARGRS